MVFFAKEAINETIFVCPYLFLLQICEDFYCDNWFVPQKHDLNVLMSFIKGVASNLCFCAVEWPQLFIVSVTITRQNVWYKCLYFSPRSCTQLTTWKKGSASETTMQHRNGLTTSLLLLSFFFFLENGKDLGWSDDVKGRTGEKKNNGLTFFAIYLLFSL